MRTLEITTKIGCTNMCHYCPQAMLIDGYNGIEMMSIETYRKILENTPTDVRIDFSGFCEPFLNPATIDMMSYSAYDWHMVLYTTLTGWRDEYLQYFKNIRFDEIVFHEWPGVNKEWFKQKYELIKAANPSHTRYVVLEPQWQWSRAGNVWDMEVKKGKFECAFAGKNFDHNVVLPNGDVYLCCQDYGLKHKIGNLLETHFDKLDRSQIYELSNREDSEAICRKCELFREA